MVLITLARFDSAAAAFHEIPENIGDDGVVQVRKIFQGQPGQDEEAFLC
jgi:hypothetical protein